MQTSSARGFRHGHTPENTSPATHGFQHALARLHRAERRFWLCWCFWAVVLTVGVTAAAGWVVLR